MVPNKLIQAIFLCVLSRKMKMRILLNDVCLQIVAEICSTFLNFTFCKLDLKKKFLLFCMYSSIFLTWQKGTTITSENCIAHLEKKGRNIFFSLFTILDGKKILFMNRFACLPVVNFKLSFWKHNPANNNKVIWVRAYK